MKNDRSMLNFNAGPAALPAEVLQQASEAVLNYNNTGLSILEIPHRGKHFDAILEESKQLVRDLCELNDDYEVLWLHGGGRLQFAMIPMNFLGSGETAGYVDSGAWASEATEYAGYYGNVNTLASSKGSNYSHLPQWPTNIPSDLSYVHFTTNNTIYGTQWKSIPKCNVPLIADMSSDIFSKRVAYNNCDLFYAVAQKNIGPAGVTLVVIKRDILKNIKRDLPPMLDYSQHVKRASVLNTPPVFAIYTSLLNLRWIKSKGIDVIERENEKKAALLYDEIERNSMFHAIVSKEDRSSMNVCFLAKTSEIESTFTRFCEKHNITGIEGHRSVKGFRVSLYNAITMEDTETLVAVMKDFESKK